MRRDLCQGLLQEGIRQSGTQPGRKSTEGLQIGVRHAAGQQGCQREVRGDNQGVEN